MIKSSNSAPGESNLKGRLLLGCLVVLVLVLFACALEETNRWSNSEVERQRSIIRQHEIARAQSLRLTYQSALEESTELLASYTDRIPFADGYVWLSRQLQESGPNLQFIVQPPDLQTPAVVSITNYCTGRFYVHGTGRLDDLLNLLRELEIVAPFVRVQELQFVFTDRIEHRVQFTMSLLTLMRLQTETTYIQTAQSGF
jgi:hypothetical protein